MPRVAQHAPIQRLLVVCPTWLGDAVMATPTLRALRRLYPQAHIAALVRQNLRPALEPCPWVDRLLTVRQPRRGMPDGGRRGVLALARRLASGRFDAAVLLPNSFRSALMVCLAGIPRRIGYGRDGRSGLLTDRLLPRRQAGRFVPVPTVQYYLGLARYLGAPAADAAMRLFTRPADDAAADALLHRAGVNLAAGRPLVILAPGASYGAAKLWPAARFAALADLCQRRWDAAVALSGALSEAAILDEVHAAARHPLIDLPRLGVGLRLLKSVFRRAAVVVTNDTGSRHVAAALGVPVVTVFGPTDPAWTEIHYERERQVMVEVFCGPCQRKTCPLDHRCMTEITPEMVFTRAAEVMVRPGPATEAAP